MVLWWQVMPNSGCDLAVATRAAIDSRVWDRNPWIVDAIEGCGRRRNKLFSIFVQGHLLSPFLVRLDYNRGQWEDPPKRRSLPRLVSSPWPDSPVPQKISESGLAVI